ncbi:type II toxin-antitoxin system VapC family toxin [Candidatus Bathyarchaeota archaeon]|nr:type II toxin-antitoxin system VapC family toxin [Candidatus Bathyarchaeota archaeon]
MLLTEKGDAPRHLEANHTLDLAYYEIGNVIWKEYALFGNISPEGARAMAGYAARIIGLMIVLRTDTPGEASETMRLAIELGLTYYDAAYLHHAESNRPLVTEDITLRKKAEEVGVEALTVKQLLER